MSDSSWPTEWLRGTLTLAVLRILADGETYGYAISHRLEAAGFGSIKGGTLYPLLARLENAGLVEVTWRAGEGGPGRKCFTLSPAGCEEYSRQRAQWLAFAEHTTDFLKDPS